MRSLQEPIRKLAIIVAQIVNVHDETRLALDEHPFDILRVVIKVGVCFHEKRLKNALLPIVVFILSDRWFEGHGWLAVGMSVCGATGGDASRTT